MSGRREDVFGGSDPSGKNTLFPPENAPPGGPATGHEPADAEARVISEMRAAHPAWTATRHEGGWLVCGADGIPVLAWHPDVYAAWKAAERAVHEPAPRPGEVLYRLGVPVRNEPRAGDYPLTCICTCGRTIERKSADAPWEYKVWE